MFSWDSTRSCSKYSPSICFSRVDKMLTYRDEGDDLYSLSRLPVERLVWGPNRKLCIRGRTTPVTVWIIGYITNLWFFDPEGHPQSKVTLGVSPMTSHAMNVARVIMGRLASPSYGE